jgi:carbon-monoxide dehydrogenase small subunit
MMRGKVHVAMRVNGAEMCCTIPPGTTVLEMLREQGLTGTREGCSVGECGACTVLVDNVPTPACLVLAAEVEGARVTTIEDTADRRIDRMRRAFLASGAFQCGACTPGMIIAASRIPVGASPAAIRAALAGNLCRCTGYASIVRAVQAAWDKHDG